MIIEGEPYLEVAEKVVQIVAGLLVASSLSQRDKKPPALKNASEIKDTRDELLRQLF